MVTWRGGINLAAAFCSMAMATRPRCVLLSFAGVQCGVGCQYWCRWIWMWWCLVSELDLERRMFTPSFAQES
jgi:hypothetical protein